jgi:hypothetical protein
MLMLTVASADLHAQQEQKPPATVIAEASGDSFSSSKSATEPAEPLKINYASLKNMSQKCEAGSVPSKACKFHWRSAFEQSLMFMTIEHLGNSSTYYNTTGPFLRNYFQAVKRQRFSRWSDDDPFMVDYVGHPMSGAITGFVQIQNDPRGMSLEISKSGAYWKSRMRAMTWAAIYSAQWEIGPFSEASFGPLGKDPYWSTTAHKYTNGTGLVDFFMTPVGGATWIVAEDTIDRFVISRLETRSNKIVWLSLISVLNPNRSVANALRFKTPWYRDSRTTRIVR